MKKLLVLCALFFAFIASASPVAAAPSDVLLDVKFKAKQVCEYPVQLVVTGKSKFVELPGDRFFVGSPGQVLTVTNLKTGEQETFLITGTTHATVQADGTTEVKITGQNVVLNSREQKSARPGLFLLQGNFDYALKANGTEARAFADTGDVTDICLLLA